MTEATAIDFTNIDSFKETLLERISSESPTLRRVSFSRQWDIRVEEPKIVRKQRFIADPSIASVQNIELICKEGNVTEEMRLKVALLIDTAYDDRISSAKISKRLEWELFHIGANGRFSSIKSGEISI